MTRVTRARPPHHPETRELASRLRRSPVKPAKSILDQSFDYASCLATAVDRTWRRFGWRPTSEEERKQRQRRIQARSPDARKQANVAEDMLKRLSNAAAHSAARGEATTSRSQLKNCQLT